jgi:pimeloyl-ACP methyl ester carboxylesterase
MTITLPSSATVYTVRGAGASLDMFSGWLKGIFDKPSYTVIPVNYPASMDAYSISDGVRMVNDLVRATPGPIVLMGHSQGSQVLSDFIGKYNDDPTVPADLTFVLCGNPVRNPTGQLVGAPVVGPLGSKGVATPAYSRWKVIDVARTGDPFAIKTNNPWWNLFADWYGKFFVHPFYKGVDLFGPANVITQNGNITLVTTP